MSDFETIQHQLYECYHLFSGESTKVVIEGESGIGKSFLIDRFIRDNDMFVVKIAGHPLSHSPYTALNQSLIDLISNKAFTKDFLKKAIHELVYMMPKFGIYLKRINDIDIKADVLKQNGITLDRPNIPGIIRLIEKISGNKPICLYCDNIQWLEKESLEAVLEILITQTEQKWYNILAYTSNAENMPLTHEEIKSKLSYIKKHGHFYHFTISRWKQKDMAIICSYILNGKCDFSNEQYSILYQYTQGVTLYIKTVLDVLILKNIIEYKDSIWLSKKDWNAKIILDILKNSVLEKIKNVYRNLPKSKQILEVASVLGEFFSEEQINSIFEINDCFQVLNEVEKQFQLIQHIIQDDFWKFDHYLIQNCIYHSIGKVKDLHLRIASCLEKKDNSDYGQVALHYKLAGNILKYNENKIREIKQLLDLGCYSAALNIVEGFEEDLLCFRLLDAHEKKSFIFLKARCLFHSKHYEKSISTLTQILDENESVNNKKTADCLKWLGKTYLKLATQQAFVTGINYLIKAQEFYSAHSLNSDLGYIYMDLTVAYAHINQLEKAREAYEKAETYFNAAKDQIGMLRLQRRNVILMENKVSAPIIEQSANVFETLDLLHEMIMSLNNAATQYIFLQNNDKSQELLERCIVASSERGGFGLAYIYNNLGVLNCYRKEYEKAKIFFDLAGKENPREVEKLIIRINESTLIARNSRKKAIPLLLEICDKAHQIGEDEYIIPAAINLSKQYFKIGDYFSAQKILLKMEDKIYKIRSYYKSYTWYNLLEKCCLKTHSISLFQEIKDKHSNKIQSTNSIQPFLYDNYILLTMQFWSEN